jgi:REP element-mobilizing transposase RayT
LLHRLQQREAAAARPLPGSCVPFAQNSFAGLLRFFDGDRYDLRAWVVMPNHVHALFKVVGTPMAEILESWKKYTSQKANRLLKRRGKFWQADYWDTFMRDGEHELETRNYIKNNPTKAGLVLDPKTWLWSSARFRDEHGVLRL